jgi:hypothetical protein
LARNEIEKGKFREQTVAEAMPKVAKMLLKAQDEAREKKQELELSVLSAETNWTCRIVERQAADAITAQALDDIENEDEEMS